MTGPGKPLAMSDFFGLEAGEYLERLDGLLQTPEPSPEEIVRVARSVRGSALMANQPAIARVAAGLEALARAAREGQRAWDAGTHQLAVRAVDDLKIAVRRVAQWTDADTARAEALAAELNRAAGRPSTAARPADGPALDAGARAFVAREGAAIASALDRASQTLGRNPRARESLQPVLRALQPLRGLAALADLPPLGDLLDGIERAIGESERGAEPGDAAELLGVAATAIARAAREVAEQGQPTPESPEFQRFAGLLVRFLATESAAVEIGTLYFNDGGPDIVQRGVVRARPTTLGNLELVSHGEHLRQAADSLERAPSATQRELRAHTLASTFRALGSVGGGPLADGLSHLAQAARDAVTSGAAVSAVQPFVALLRRAGDLLARSGVADSAELAAELEALARSLKGLATPLAPQRTAPASEPAREDALPETPDLLGSWVVYQRLRAAEPATAAIESLLLAASRDTGPPSRSASPESGVVDIRALVYRGDRALVRAREVRAAAQHASAETLRTLVAEACDLVALALEPATPS